MTKLRTVVSCRAVLHPLHPFHSVQVRPVHSVVVHSVSRKMRTNMDPGLVLHLRAVLDTHLVTGGVVPSDSDLGGRITGFIIPMAMAMSAGDKYEREE